MSKPTATTAKFPTIRDYFHLPWLAHEVMQPPSHVGDKYQLVVLVRLRAHDIPAAGLEQAVSHKARSLPLNCVSLKAAEAIQRPHQGAL